MNAEAFHRVFKGLYLTGKGFVSNIAESSMVYAEILFFSFIMYEDMYEDIREPLSCEAKWKDLLELLRVKKQKMEMMMIRNLLEEKQKVLISHLTQV